MYCAPRTPSVRFAASFPTSGEAVPVCRFPIHGEAPAKPVKGCARATQAFAHKTNLIHKGNFWGGFQLLVDQAVINMGSNR
jgi:hypothetical protein